MTETETSDENTKASELINDSQFKSLMEFFERVGKSTIQETMANVQIADTLKKIRKMVNILRKLGFISMKFDKNKKVHLISVCPFDKNKLPPDITKYLKQQIDE